MKCLCGLLYRTMEIVPFNNHNVFSEDINRKSQFHQLFDSVHDFKNKFGICYDSILFKKDKSCSYEKLCFSFLSNFCFDLYENNEKMVAFLNDFANLSTASGQLPLKYNSGQLEEIFARNAEQGKSIKVFVSSQITKTGDNSVEDYFANYKYKSGPEEGGLLHLLVDTQKSFFKQLETIKGHSFAYVLTRESVYDPAPKLYNPVSYQKIFGNKYFIENDNGQNRSYIVPGNYQIALSPITTNGSDKKARPQVTYKINHKTVSTDSKINTCVLNSSSKHPNCITQVNNNVNKEITDMNGNGALRFDCTDTRQLPNLNLQTFYSENLSKIKGFDIKQIKEICKLFSQKRLGDALQAYVVQYSHDPQNLEISCSRQLLEMNVDKNVKNFILVTIDQMLYALALNIGVPAIYDDGANLHCYNPSKQSIQGGSGKRKAKTSTVTIEPNIEMKDEPPPVRLFEVSEVTKFVQEEPYIFLTLLPFMFPKDTHDQLGSTNEKLTEMIGNVNVVLTSESTFAYLSKEINDNQTCKTLYCVNDDKFGEEIYNQIKDLNEGKKKYFIFINDNFYVRKEPNNSFFWKCYSKREYEIDNVLLNSVLGVRINLKVHELVSRSDMLVEELTHDEGDSIGKIKDDLQIYDPIENHIIEPSYIISKPRSSFMDEIKSEFYKGTKKALFKIFIVILFYFSVSFTYNKLFGQTGGGDNLPLSLKRIPRNLNNASYLTNMNKIYLYFLLHLFEYYEVNYSLDIELCELEFTNGKPVYSEMYHFLQYLIKHFDTIKETCCLFFLEPILLKTNVNLYIRLQHIKQTIMQDEFEDVSYAEWESIVREIVNMNPDTNSGVYNQTEAFIAGFNNSTDSFEEPYRYMSIVLKRNFETAFIDPIELPATPEASDVTVSTDAVPLPVPAALPPPAVTEQMPQPTNVYDPTNTPSSVFDGIRGTAKRVVNNFTRGFRMPTMFGGGGKHHRRNRTLRHRSRMSQEYTFNINSKGSNPLNVNLNLRDKPI
jgi:hypothetical protein